MSIIAGIACGGSALRAPTVTRRCRSLRQASRHSSRSIAMKPHRIAFAASIVALAACAAPPPPTAPASSVDAPAAKRVAGSESVDPLWILRAFGTEPFWNVRVEGRTLIYTTPEDQAGRAMRGERRATADGVEISGSHEGKAFTLTVAKGDCSDGMSDNVYDLTAEFRYGDMDYKGCAEAAI
jgi:uncharacterized membrane protein